MYFNAIKAGSSEGRVRYRQTGKANSRVMAPDVVKIATFLGGSMNFNNCAGVRRFGMAMKAAALSISSVIELYSGKSRMPL